MSYIKEFKEYNKEEGHGRGKPQKPNPDFLKTIFKNLLFILVLFCIYHYGYRIIDSLSSIKDQISNEFKAEPAEDNPEEDMLEEAIVEEVVVEDQSEDDTIPRENYIGPSRDTINEEYSIDLEEEPVTAIVP